MEPYMELCELSLEQSNSLINEVRMYIRQVDSFSIGKPDKFIATH